ncbi:hypothetical protein SprV_0301215300 [Sparganum proliferum]
MIENANKEQVSNLLEGLQRCRLEGLYTDIILCVDEEEFPCHKVILAASSRYFDTMFRIPLSEQKTSRVYIKQISPWSLKHLIDFAYTGSLALSTQTVQDVFLAANLLDYPLAVEACILFMKRHLDISNCLGVQLLAEAYEFPALAEAARKVAVDNFTRLVQESTEWLSLPFASVAAYLASEDLDVRSEQVVLKACLSWVAHDPDNRLRYLVTLLHHVRLHQIPTQRLKEIIETSSVLRDCYTACEYAETVLKAKLSPVSPTASQVNDLDNNSNSTSTGTEVGQDTSPPPTDPVSAVSSLAPPRPATVKRDTLIVLGGINSYILDSVEALSFSKSCWLPCPRIPTDSLTCFSAIVVDNTLIVTGGIRAGTIVSSVYRYVVEDNAWTVGADMLQPRARHASVAILNSLLFVFGGVTISSRSDAAAVASRLEEADSVAGHLSENADAADIFDANAVPDLSLVETIDCYDVRLDRWTTVGRCRSPRQGSSVVVISNTPSTPSDDFCSMPTHKDSWHASEIDQYLDHHHPYTIMEMGGTLDVYSLIVSDRMAIYHVNTDFSVQTPEDYIALPQPVRYAKCAVDPPSKLVYIFWELTGELSVLDFYRQSMRSLKPLSSLPQAAGARVHCGCAWVNHRLYVLGGFGHFVGADRRPTAARDDLHCYDPLTDTWSEVLLREQRVPRAMCGCVCLRM